MLQRDADGNAAARCLRVELTQLQRNAFAQIAGADTRRLQALNGAEDALDIRDARFDFGQQTGADVLETVLQVAVIVDGIDDDARDGRVDRGQFRQVQLLEQLFLQGLAVFIAQIGVAIVIAGPGRIGNACRLLSPGLIGNLDFGLFALIAFGHGVAAELDIFFLCDRGFEVAQGFRSERVGGQFVLGLEHDVGFEGLANMRLQVKRGKLQ